VRLDRRSNRRKFLPAIVAGPCSIDERLHAIVTEHEWREHAARGGRPMRKRVGQPARSGRGSVRKHGVERESGQERREQHGSAFTQLREIDSECSDAKRAGRTSLGRPADAEVRLQAWMIGVFRRRDRDHRDRRRV